MKTTAFLTALLITLNAASQNIPENMVLISGGEFTMGKDVQGAAFSPAHKVTIDPFYLDTHEVTNAEYKKFCDATNYKLPEFWGVDVFRSGEKFADYPVVGISWGDARKYAEWAGKRLPTEAEWEFAGRGGLARKEYPTGDTLGRIEEKKVPGAWENHIVKVSSFKPNRFGLYDMDGNVWEWVEDTYDLNFYANSPANNPIAAVPGFNKVIRSGSWHSGNMCKKVYYRKGIPSNWVDFGVGFRCAKSVGRK
jgi:formylglycine-generating enzyme required for sulfatase activity